MVAEVTNNLITRAVMTPSKPLETTTIPETKNDNFEKATIIKKPITPKEPSKTMKILNGVLSTGLLIGLFFLPDIISAFRNKKMINIIDKYKNFKPVIGDVLTGQKQEVLKNGKIKITLENIKDKFKYNEIIIMDKSKIKQRIVIRKEQLPNGNYIVRNVKSYKGDNLIDTAEIDKNEAKYLFKRFKRSATHNRQYRTTIERKGKEAENYQFCVSPQGEPVLRTKETEKEKENTIFLYLKNKCVGIDKQVIPKANPENQYNLLTIPRADIVRQKYNLLKDGPQYEEQLTEKLRQNF